MKRKIIISTAAKTGNMRIINKAKGIWKNQHNYLIHGNRTQFGILKYYYQVVEFVKQQKDPFGNTVAIYNVEV